MPRRAITAGAAAIAAVLGLMAVAPAHAQTFTRILDPAIVAAPDSCSASSWIDVDGDGDLDLFVTTWSSASPNLLFLNNGSGVFTRAVIPALDASRLEAFGSSWADADDDGLPDLYVSQLFNGGGTLFRNAAGLAFAPMAGAVTGPAIKGNACWADIDLDGDADLVIACLNGTGGITTPNRLFENHGGLTFTARDTGVLVTTVDTHHTASWADFDNDGDPDLFFAAGGVGSTKRDRLYQNMRVETGVAWFRPITTGALATDFHDAQLLSWADYDNDGDLDCYVLDYTSLPNLLYRNDGGGVFTRVTTAGPIVTDTGASHGCAWGDFDNDGDLDVYVARDASQANRFYRNNGDGTFASVTTGDFVTRISSNWNAVAGDMDRDGDLDLFVPIRSPALPGLLYRNELAAGSHWLELHCVGLASNASALGARVRLKARIGGVDRWQMREVATGTSYGGHNMLDVHFGLGDAAVADSIDIRWPSGIRQVLTNVPANQVLSVIEDVSTAVTAAAVTARAESGVVEIVWEISGGVGTVVGVERSLDSGTWERRGSNFADGSRRVRFIEAAPTDAAHASYRLKLREGDAFTIAGEVSIDLGARDATSFRVSGGRGAGDPLIARFALRRAGEVRIDLLDILGRRIGQTHRVSLPAGEHAIPLGRAPELAAGLYWVRARLDEQFVTTRALQLR